MTISSALSNATSGLAVASRRAGVVSDNIANALTPGYAKRTANVSANVIGGAGAGVNYDGVTRSVDPAITSDRRNAESAASRDEIIASAYGSFNDALGETDDSFSLFAQYENLESSLRQLSQSPESQAAQAETVDAAKALTSQLQTLSEQAQTARINADSEIAQRVETINNALQEIEKLNDAIALASAGGRDATALEDQRQTLIDTVNESIAVREVARDNGRVDIITEEGVFLVAGNAREIEFTQATTIGAADTLASGALSGLTVGSIDITPGGASSLASTDGALAGLFAVRDEIAPEFQAQLDGLARDMIERFEGIDPTLASGDPGLFTDAGAAFDPANETGLAARIAVNAAVDPDQGGSVWRIRDGLGASAQGASGSADIINTALDALTALKAPPAGTGQTSTVDAVTLVANVTSSVGQARLSSESTLAASSARAESLVEAELSVTGVDTDQQLQELLLIEQAFAANARVIQAADEMMQRLIDL